MEGEKKIVYKREDGQDPRDIKCTTYQMRNFYAQFADGFFSNLDWMNYIQHYAVARMAKKGASVLDVCCGRSLLLPLLRYYAGDIEKYTGVDICEKNINEAKGGASRAARGKKLTPEELEKYYPFKTEWLLHDVATMSEVVPEASQDLVVYTSALEHMHKEFGAKSLEECFKVMKDSGVMFLSCPNTPGNGFDVQYAAHVYEWGYDELKQELERIGFHIEHEVGLVMSAADMKAMVEELPQDLQKFYKTMGKYLPTSLMTVLMGIPYPKKSKEILFICRKKKPEASGGFFDLDDLRPENIEDD